MNINILVGSGPALGPIAGSATVYTSYNLPKKLTSSIAHYACTVDKEANKRKFPTATP